MWLFTQHSYLAITQNRDDRGLFHVRARVSGDIEKYWPLAKVKFTPESDFAYRTDLPKTEVMNAIAHAIMAIDYTSFKGSIEDKRRSPYYIEVWTATGNMQDDLLALEDVI